MKKALDLVANPLKYTKATAYGAAKYAKNLEIDKETGEVDVKKQYPVFDDAKLKEEELYDGCYAIVTSEPNMPADKVIELYRGLSLVILRLIQKNPADRFSVDKIVECLNKISRSNEQDNIYLFDYKSEISDTLGQAFGLNFSRKRMRLAEIKNILALSKK